MSTIKYLFEMVTNLLATMPVDETPDAKAAKNQLEDFQSRLSAMNHQRVTHESVAAIEEEIYTHLYNDHTLRKRFVADLSAEIISRYESALAFLANIATKRALTADEERRQAKAKHQIEILRILHEQDRQS